MLDNDRGPLTVDLFPRSDLAERRMKMISKRHVVFLSESRRGSICTDFPQQFQFTISNW